MITLLACAKTMQGGSLAHTYEMSTPAFGNVAADLAVQMSTYSIEELAMLLHTNSHIAATNYRRWQTFHEDRPVSLPALLAYTGIVFKYLQAVDLAPAEIHWAQEHLYITSFLYGLLRPLDAIKPYRLEGNVQIPTMQEENMFHFWRKRLTQPFIHSIEQQGGILCHLASDEMRALFDWKAVARAVRIITPEFYVYKGDKPKTVVIYTKMARGAMARYIIKERIEDPALLQHFSWEGFVYSTALSTPDKPVFIQG